MSGFALQTSRSSIINKITLIMFDELSSRFEDAVKGLRGEAKISENNINEALKDVKRALLDADVSLSVVKEFISDVKEKAIGEK